MRESKKFIFAIKHLVISGSYFEKIYVFRGCVNLFEIIPIKWWMTKIHKIEAWFLNCCQFFDRIELSIKDGNAMFCLRKFKYRTRAIITRGLCIFYPLFEVHLCTVTWENVGPILMTIVIWVVEFSRERYKIRNINLEI